MARTISWISRSAEIRAAVEKSVQSHFARTDIEWLFQLQSSAANALITLLPRGRGPGGVSLVERGALQQFLEDVERTGTLPTERVKASRKKVRTMTLKPAREVGRGSVDSIPASVRFQAGRVIVDHKGAEDLIGQLWTLALAARDDEERFRHLVRVELLQPKPPSEMDALEAELEEIRARKRPGTVVSIAASAEEAS